MCGICGISVHPATDLPVSELLAELLLGIEHRGTHATGIHATGGTVERPFTLREPRTATLFVEDLPEQITGATVLLGHTRYATQGSPHARVAGHYVNNHPITVASDTGSTITGIHNGVIWNDDDLFANLDDPTRIGEVDSEAAFAWIARSGHDQVEALRYLRGSAALAWVDHDDPDTLHLARVDSSPLFIGHTITGELLFASTRRCIEDAASIMDVALKAVVRIPERTYLMVRFGRIIFRTTIGAPLALTHTRDVDVEALQAATDAALGTPGEWDDLGYVPDDADYWAWEDDTADAEADRYARLHSLTESEFALYEQLALD